MLTPQEIIKKVQVNILQFEEQQIWLTETETRNALINPIFAAIGWDTGNPAIVRMEWRKNPNDRPVDYAFMIGGIPKLLVEAEKLKEDINDKKWRDQLLLYSTQLGIKWCVLTNGNIIRIYNSLAEEEASDKLLFEIEIKTIDTPVGLSIGSFMEKLSLLSEESLHEGKINEVWDNIYTTRKVFDYLKDRKEALINDITKSAKLTKKSVGDVLDQIIKLRESFLKEKQDNGKDNDNDKPWLIDGEKWHLVNRLKSKSMGQLSDTAKRLQRISEIIKSISLDVTGPYWGQKGYVTFKARNTGWLHIWTHGNVLYIEIICEADQFSLEDFSEKLGVKVFDQGAKLSEKRKFPSSIHKLKENDIALRIKSDFNLENKEFKRFLEEAYKSFIGK